MTHPISGSLAPDLREQKKEVLMNAEVATNYVRSMVDQETRGHGDLELALDRLERRYGIGRWTLSRLRKGRSKTVDASLFQRIHFAYLDFCQRQVAAIKHEIEIEEAKGDDLSLIHI